MRWDELRGLGTIHALWEIPGDRTKNRRAHLVPLAPIVQDILLANSSNIFDCVHYQQLDRRVGL